MGGGGWGRQFPRGKGSNACGGKVGNKNVWAARWDTWVRKHFCENIVWLQEGHGPYKRSGFFLFVFGFYQTVVCLSFSSRENIYMLVCSS